MIKTQHCPNCEATEQKLHDFRQEVSGVMTYIKALYPTLPRNFNRFIIPAPKPDPLVEAMKEAGWSDRDIYNAEPSLRAALDALGLEIREKGQ
jgi:hypothetical protein